MSRLRIRMIQDMKLAGLVEGTQDQYLRAVRQLTAYYMIAPDHLSERQVEKYILYVRDELGVARGTFVPLFCGLKFFCDLPLERPRGGCVAHRAAAGR